MNYIIVTGLIIAGLVLLDALSKYRSQRWRSDAHEIFANIAAALLDPVDLNDIRRARDCCDRGKRYTLTSEGDSDANFIKEIAVAAGILLLFCILGFAHDHDMDALRKEVTPVAQQEQAQQPTTQEAACTEQK